MFAHVGAALSGPTIYPFVYDIVVDELVLNFTACLFEYIAPGTYILHPLAPVLFKKSE